MIIDLNEYEGDPFDGSVFDVCICGAGVAGITLALNLPSKLSVILIEAGGLEYSTESQALYKGQNVGQTYADLSASRLRFFGGSSNHWHGWCRPLDSYDFEPKPFLEVSGWPIRRSDIDPYLEASESMLDLPLDQRWEDPSGVVGEKINATEDFQSFEFKFSTPTLFGKKYREEIQQRSNISCYLNTNLTQLHLNEGLSSLDRIEVRRYSGQTHQIRARTFVLAAGGIENPRLLLNSDHQVPGGIGNQNGLVGRYFSEHPEYKVGEFILEDHVLENGSGSSFKEKLRSVLCGSEWALKAAEFARGEELSCVDQTRRQFFSPSPAFMDREKILNFGMRFNVSSGQDGETDGFLHLASEQALNPSSRVTLGTDQDKFGMRPAILDWQLTDIDLQTMKRATLRFGEVLSDTKLGRVKLSEWLLSEPIKYGGGWGWHHMCTTRMSETPVDGVVDADLRVFGTNNLYIAGSSVFSTGGYANPTLTIVQLTLRLADHLGSKLDS